MFSKQMLYNIINILHNVFSDQTLFKMIFCSTLSMYAQKYVYIPIIIFVDSLLKVMLISVLKSFYVLQNVAEYNIFMSYDCPGHVRIWHF